MTIFPGHLTPIKAADGTKPDADGQGFTLLADTTYYVEAGGGSDDVLSSLHVKWDDELIMTIKVEDSSFDEIAANDETPGNWIPEEDANAGLTPVGGTADGLEVTVAGGEAGGVMYHFGNSGAQRTRLKLTVGGTGGYARFSRHGKR